MEPAALPDLVAARCKRGLSLNEIARDTKIGVHYLDAIEHGRFGALPGGVYDRSYIRQYARAISYDEAKLLAYYGAVGSQ
jgi:cytoskeleton protein RodZ